MIVPALCSSIADADAGAAVADCCLVLGCFCSLPLLLQHLTPRLQEWDAEPPGQAHALQVLAGVLRCVRGVWPARCAVCASLLHCSAPHRCPAPPTCRGAAPTGQLAGEAEHELQQLVGSPALAGSTDARLQEALAAVQLHMQP